MPEGLLYGRYAVAGKAARVAGPVARRRVQEFMAQIGERVAEVPNAQMFELTHVLKRAERELSEGLAKWLSEAGDAGDRFTAHQLRSALAQTRGALEALGEAVPAMDKAMRAGNRSLAALSNEMLATEIARLAGVMGGVSAMVPIDLPTAAHLVDRNRSLLVRFEQSSVRYGESAMKSIRSKMAVGVVKGESIGQMARRVAKIRGVPWKGAMPGPAETARSMARGLMKGPYGEAERIVRTELNNAYNAHHQRAIEEVAEFTPGMRRRWDASIDSRVCELCRELDGEVQNVDVEFTGGFMYPPRHPYCRCVVIPWMEDWPEVKPLPIRPELNRRAVG